MPVETGDYINSLVITEPQDSEAKKFGAGYFRFLKKVIKQTFPNITGAMNRTHTQLNLFETAGANIASAASIDIGVATGNFVTITGTTTITALGTIAAGARRTLLFSGALVITTSTLNASVAANDILEVISLGSGNWQLLNHFRALGNVVGSQSGHRLSLTTALAVTVADVTAAGTIYWTPSKHNLSPIYVDATVGWMLLPISEKSFILDTTNFLANTNYCLWLDYNAGSPRIVAGPAWTSATARVASGEVARDATYGYVVNNASITVRLSNDGGTASKGAGTLLYLGTIRCSANGQTEDSLAKRFVWNMYNRASRAMQVLEATNSWTYSTAAFQQANASTANQLAFVRGLNEDAVKVNVLGIASSSLATARQVVVGVGIDSVTAATGLRGITTTASDGNREVAASYSGFPGLGYHYAAWLEYGAGADTQTWLGDNGSTVVQSGITGEVLA